MPRPDYRELVRSYLDLRWHLDPVAATQAGVGGHDARLGDFSRPQIKVALAALKAMAAAFEYSEPASLDEEVDQTAVLNDLRVTIARFEKEKPQELNPEFHLSLLFDGLFALLLRTDRSVEERGRALTGRLRETPRFLQDAQATLGRPAQVFSETALAVAAGGRALFGEAIPEFAARLSPVARAAALEALEAARPAMEEFVAFLGGELADRSDADFAIGRDQFDFRLHFGHALRETAPALLRYGEALIRETELDLERRRWRRACHGARSSSACGRTIPAATGWSPPTVAPWSAPADSWRSAGWSPSRMGRSRWSRHRRSCSR